MTLPWEVGQLKAKAQQVAVMRKALNDHLKEFDGKECNPARIRPMFRWESRNAVPFENTFKKAVMQRGAFVSQHTLQRPRKLDLAPKDGAKGRLGVQAPRSPTKKDK